MSTTKPRSAAARRAAGEGEHPADTAEKSPTAELNEGEDLAAQLAQAQAARQQAEEDARLAREEAQLAREQAEEMRESAAAVQAAAEIPLPDETAGAVPAHAGLSDPPAHETGPRSVVPRGEDDTALDPEEMALIKRIRRDRAREIKDQIARAPRQVGIDLDQYTLVHLRGCPNPERTETYEATNTGNGQTFTIHRCVECGAHLPIPH